MAYGSEAALRFIKGAVGLPLAFIATSLLVSGAISVYEMGTDAVKTGEVPIDSKDLPDANDTPKDAKVELAVNPGELQYKFYGILALVGGIGWAALGRRK